MALQIPTLTPEQMREVDDLMVKHYHIEVLQMMEHDARGLAEVAKEIFNGSLIDKRVVVFCGKGGNGAGGLAAARHLHNAGAEVKCVLAAEIESLSQEGRHHIETLREIGIPIMIHSESGWEQEIDKADIAIDALLGYSAIGDPKPPYDELILAINKAQQSGVKVLANDIPSGLDVKSGEPHKPCVRADVTMTVALPKTGLLKLAAKDWVGQLYLCDIGVPPELYAKMNLSIGVIFDKKWIIKL